MPDMTSDGLIIRETKFKKSRLIPLHKSVVESLDQYLDERRQYDRGDDHVFISQRGGHSLAYSTVAETFREVLKFADIPQPPDDRRPRLLDFRHRFAVRALESCPDSRDRITRNMLALSTYMGHARLEDTYWYLESTPRLMVDIATLCELFIKGEKA